MHSSVVKRSIVIGQHAVKEIATSRGTTCSDLVSEINERRQAPNLSSAIRLFVLEYYQDRAGQSEKPLRHREF